MRSGVHPLYAFLGALVAVLVAMFVAPVFPVPLSTLLYWAGWITAVVLVILGVIGLAKRTGV